MRRILIATVGCLGFCPFVAGAAERDFPIQYGMPAPREAKPTTHQDDYRGGSGWLPGYGSLYPPSFGFGGYANPMMNYSMLGFPGYGYSPTGYYSFGGLGGYSSLNYYNFGGLGSYPWAGYPNYGPYFSYLPYTSSPWFAPGGLAYGGAAPFMNRSGAESSSPAAAEPAHAGATGALIIDFPRAAGGSASYGTAHAVDFPKSAEPPRPAAVAP